MKPGPITPIRFQGSFNQRRPWSWKKIFFSMLGMGAAGGIGYLLFFSPLMRIQHIEAQGFERVKKEDIVASIQANRSIIFFNVEDAEEELEKKFPSLKDVKVIKKYFNGLSIVGTERVPMGIWCRGQECSYFDNEGMIWGKAIKSFGTLLIVVNDEREGSIQLDRDFSEGIKLAAQYLPSLGITMKDIEIPADMFNEFRINTVQGYYLAFALDSNIERQLDVLKVFLNEKRSDPNFTPKEYIDLRIDGRVYFDSVPILTPSSTPTPEATISPIQGA